MAGLNSRKNIRDSTAEMLLMMEEAGLPLSEQHRQEVRIAGLGAALDGVSKPVSRRDIPGLDGRQHLWLTPEQAKKARERKENPQPEAECYLDRIPREWRTKWKDRPITKEDWCPERPDLHAMQEDFRKFVASQFPRFDRLIPNERFYLYIEQARRWLAENGSVQDYEGEEAREYGFEEFRRIEENKLYGANKYGFIRDDTQPGGYRKYEASTPQALICWERDCVFSGEVGKGRQAAVTSTFMLCVALTMITTASYKGVLVTDDVEFTGKQIFGDKMQGCIQIMLLKNPWMKPNKAPNWGARKTTLAWGVGTAKQEQKVFSSEYLLAASNETQTINGTTPSEVDFDEAQNISTYQDIKLENRPTMLSTGADGVVRVARMYWAYGTGSRKQSGGGAFENEYKGTIYKWMRGESTSTTVPSFFDWTCRPNMTEELYIQEYDYYMSREDDGMAGLTREERAAVFFSAYPSRPEDMFLTSHKTIVPAMIIAGQQDRITKYCHDNCRPVPGHFEPVFDNSRKMPEGSYLPYFVNKSRWIAHDPDDFEAPCFMFLPPPAKPWVYRNYQGTDPIASASGKSKFASAIWDNVGVDYEINGQRIFRPTVACLLNHRTDVIEDTFNQSILMGMHYANHGQRACMELFEINRGGEYERWKKSAMFDLERSLWMRAALPTQYRGGGHIYGIDMKNNSSNSRKTSLFYDIGAFVREHGHNIWYYEYWTQLHNIEVTEKATGAMEFATRDKNTLNDDIVYAVQYAHLSCRTDGKDPKRIDADNPQYEVREVRRRNPRTQEIYYEQERVQVVYA